MWGGAGAVKRLLPMRVRGWVGVGRGAEGEAVGVVSLGSGMTVLLPGEEENG